MIVPNEQHATIQFFILLVTIGSFYAFGWPKDVKLANPAEVHAAFSEICVILVLYLLSELAAYLTLASTRVTSQLDATAGAMSSSLQSAATTAVEGIKKQTDPIATELEKLAQKLGAEQFGDAVQTLLGIAEVSRAVGFIKSAEMKQWFLKEIAKYAEAWAAFLDSVDDTSDVQSVLRFNCAKRLLTSYVSIEAKELGYDSTSKQRSPTASVNIVTNEQLYFQILTDMIATHSEAGIQVFAWAITNVTPYEFFHWGEKYGDYGSHPFMDGFRDAVGARVAAGQTYERLFLLHENVAKEASESETGVALFPAIRIVKQNDLVLLRISEDGAPLPETDIPKPVHLWKQLSNVWEHIVGKDSGEFPPEKLFYGIVPKTISDGLGWEMNKDTCVDKQGEKLGTFKVHPVPFLTHFQEKYQSLSGMHFHHIPDSTRLIAELENNPDCLILGLKEGDQHIPVIAISTNIVPNSDAMRMRIFTSKDELAHIHKFWKDTEAQWKSLEAFVAEVSSKAAAADKASVDKFTH